MHKLPEKTRSARADAIMELQQQIAFDQAAQQVGKSFEVLIDQQADDDQFIARHLGQAPEVDSVTYVLSDQLHPGEFVHVLCEGSKEYDLIARPTEGILP